MRSYNIVPAELYFLKIIFSINIPVPRDLEHLILYVSFNTVKDVIIIVKKTT